MVPIMMRSRRDPIRRLMRREWRDGDVEERGERRTDRRIGKKRRPSPEISRSFRIGRGRSGWDRV